MCARRCERAPRDGVASSKKDRPLSWASSSDNAQCARTRPESLLAAREKCPSIAVACTTSATGRVGRTHRLASASGRAALARCGGPRSTWRDRLPKLSVSRSRRSDCHLSVLVREKSLPQIYRYKVFDAASRMSFKSACTSQRAISSTLSFGTFCDDKFFSTDPVRRTRAHLKKVKE